MCLDHVQFPQVDTRHKILTSLPIVIDTKCTSVRFMPSCYTLMHKCINISRLKKNEFNIMHNFIVMICFTLPNPFSHLKETKKEPKDKNAEIWSEREKLVVLDKTLEI